MANVIDPMEALRRSVGHEAAPGGIVRLMRDAPDETEPD